MCIRTLRAVWLLVLLFITGNLFSQPLPGPAGPISGLPHVCRLDYGVAYTVDPIANAASYNWTLPSGANILTGSGTNSITVEYTSAAVSGTVSVYGTNASGSGDPSYLNVTVNPLPVPTIAGLSQVCSGTSGVIYTTEPGMQSYNWSISAGGVITSGNGTSMVIVTWNTPGAQTISVSYTNLNNCTAATPTVKNVNVLASPTPTITGLTSVCQGATGVSYTTESGMTAYNWTLSSGGTIVSGTGTNSILVNWTSAGSHTVTVNYTSTNGCATTAPGSLGVTVLPFTPPAINGPSAICVGTSGVTYTTEAGMTGYTWTISSGGNIDSGTGTNTVTVTWSGAGTQSIAVNYTAPNGCTASTPTVRQVNVMSYSTPVITGNASVCAGSGGTPYVTETGMTGYTWSVSSGGTILSGAGTNSILVDWTVPGPQNVSVSYTNPGGCTLPIPTIKNVTVLASPTPTITGLASACAGSSGITYTTEAGMTGYSWSITGGTITSGAGSNVVTVTWTTAGAGQIRVNYVNASGCSAGSPAQKTVTVYPIPVPVITGPATACVGTSGVTYSTDGGMTGYTWNISAGGTITGGAGTSIITVTWSTVGNQSVSVNYTSPDGCSASAPTTKQVTVAALPVPTITGPAAACAGSTGVTYTTEAGMQNYSWNVSAGGTITQGENTNSIKVTWSLTGAQTVSVVYSSAAGCPAASVTVKNVTVNPLPVPTITGTDALCAGTSGVVYSTESGMTGYSWTVSSGGTITSGAGTSAITVTWSTAGSKTVTVNYYTAAGCQAATPAAKAVTVYERPVPVITGNASSCAGTSGVVYTTESGMTGYTWTISSGGTIIAGSGTSAITVNWNNAGPQTISVNYTNPSGCAATAATVKNVTVNALPVPTITGPANACLDTLDYTFSTEAGMTGYTWAVSPGGTIRTGAGTGTIQVRWSSSGSQWVSVYYTDLNGCTASVITVKNVTVHDLPVPAITGNASLCTGTTGVTYTTEAGMTGYTWTTSAGGVITGGGNSNVATVTWNTPGAQWVSVNYANSNGCRAITATQFPVTVLPLPAPAITGPDSLCAGSSGIIYQTEAGMTGYAWTVSSGGTITTGAATSAITVTWSTAGPKQVSVNYINGNGCTALSPTTKNITIHPLPVPTITGIDSLCAGTSGVTYSTEPGMNSYNWNISPGGTITSGSGTNNVTVQWSAAGTQSVIVGYTSPKGCASAAPASKTVRVHPIPVPSILGPDSLCVGTTGVAYSTEPGMSDYQWTVSAGGTITGGAGTNTINVSWNMNGTHTVSVSYKSTKGCYPVAPSVKNIRVFLRPAPTISGSDSLCAGTTGVMYTTEPGMTGYTWTLSSGGLITSGAGTNTVLVTWSVAGNQTVSVNYANQKGCMALLPTSKTIRVLPLPVPVISGSDSLCIGSSGIAYTTQTGMTGYSWTVSPGGTITAGTGTAAITVDWTIAGNQTVSVTYTNTKGCMPVSPTVKNVIVHPLPVPTIIGPDSLCAGTAGNTYLTQAGMTGYMWSVTGGTITSGAGSNQVSVLWSTPGIQTISVSYYSPKGCQAASPAIRNIRVFALPVPTIAGSDSLCAGTSGVVYSTETGMNGYTWNISAGGTITSGLGTSSVTVSWNAPGTQSVSVTYISPKGCLAASPTVKSIHVFTLPVPTIAGSSQVCAGSAGVSYATETGMTGYTWNISSGGTITAGAGTNLITVTWTTPGTQAVSVYYTNQRGCTAPVPTIKNIQILPLPVPAVFGLDVACQGTGSNLYSSHPGMSAYVWTLSPGGVITGGQGTDTIQVTWNTAGIQTVSVGYTNPQGCTSAAPASKTILVHPLPVPAILGPDSLCAGAAGISYTTDPGMTGYLWSVSPGGTIVGSAGSSIVSVTWNNSGNQWIEVNYTNANGCNALTPTRKTITIHPRPVAALAGPDSLCAGIADVTYSTDPGKTGYLWTVTSGGVISGGAGTDSIQVAWITPGSQSVTVTYTDEKGCTPASPALLPVIVHAHPVPLITGPSSMCLTDSLKTYSTETGMTGYLWTVSSGGTIHSGQGTSALAVSWDTAGTHQISVTYTNTKGCSAATPAVRTIQIHALPEPTIAGADSLCEGTAGVVYATETGMTGYQWSVSSGGVISSGSGTSAVTVTWNTPGNQWVQVNYKNSNGCSAVTPTLRAVTVHPVPVPALTGSDSTCAGTTGNIYATEAGMTGYTWNISAGGVITSGTGTDSVTVDWITPGSQQISVAYTSSKGCPSALPTTLGVTVHAPPSPTIMGADTLCNGATAILYTTESGMSDYLWEVSPGGTIVSGAGTSSVTVNWTGSGSQFVTVNYKNSKGCYAPTPTQLNVTIYPYPVPVITGPVSVCSGDTGVLYVTDSGMSGYAWNITPGGSITAGAGTDSILVSWSATGAQAVSVSYTSPEGCAAAAPVVFPVTVNTPPVPSITGSNAVCEGTSGVTYTTQAGMTGYTWTVSPEGTIVSGSGTSAITVNWNTPGSATVSIDYTNASGCNAATPTVLDVTVHPLPVPTITGTDDICVNGTGSYATETGMTGYQWSVSAGGIITSGAGTSAVQVQWTTAGSKTVTVNYTGPGGCTAATPASFNVTVYPLPVPVISGLNNVCEGTPAVLYTTETGMTGYLWTVTPGGAIVSGQGTDSVLIDWTAAGIQVVSVTYTNPGGCNPLVPSNYTVTVNIVPVPTISGNTTVCQGSTYIYSTQTGQSAYLWAVSPGGTITDGQGTSSATINWTGEGSQWVSVTWTSQAGCPAAEPDTLSVWANPLPSAPGAISGPAEVCAPAAWVQYIAEPATNAVNYAWSFPPGAVITAGGNTNVVHVTFTPGAQSGDITVYATNACGAGPVSQSFFVTVKQTPPTPVITLYGADSLVSDAPAGNQWYLDGNALPGAVFPYHIAEKSGSYTVLVTLEGCVSETSNSIYIVMTGAGEAELAGIRVYPNPADLELRVVSPSEMTEIHLMNTLGQVVLTASPKSNQALLDISEFKPGIYLLRVITTRGDQIFRVLVE